jgi:hypothetical protein
MCGFRLREAAFRMMLSIAGRTLRRVRDTMIATPLEAYSIRRHIAGNIKRGGGS